MTASEPNCFHRIFCLALLISGFWLIGCDRPEVRVYNAPKDKPAATAEKPDSAPPAAEAPTVSASVDGIRFKVPASWKKTEPDPSMPPIFAASRLIGYDVSNAAGRAEVTITRIRGGGTVLDNVNRWRTQQLHLEPVEEVNASDISKVKIGGQDAELFRAASEEKTLVAAFLTRDGSMVTFKLLGATNPVEEQEAAFADFLRTVEFTK